MPNRIIKESICTSDEIDQLDAMCETLFYRLMVSVDDFGLLDARPAIVKSKCYPLKSIDINSIQAMLGILSDIGLISLYQVEGKPYLQITSWSKHQQIRAQRAKYPTPDMGSDITCNQLISDAPVIQSNPIQSESNRNPILSPSADLQKPTSEKFDLFWTTWPATDRRTQRAKCVAHWVKNKLDLKSDLIITHIAELKKTEKWISGFEPAPLTYLNGKQWEDGLPEIPRTHHPPVRNIHEERAKTIAALTGTSGNESINEHDITGQAERIA